MPIVPYVAAAAHVVLHLATSFNYGLFRDEFYYLACADRLDWGYVDHPPLSIALLWLVRLVLGDSVLALRLVPALAGAALVVLAARLARELGGGPLASALAAVAVAIVPLYLALTSYYSMNSFDLLAWAGLAWVLARLVRTGDPRYWLAFGAIAGIGLLNKISVFFFCAGTAIAVVATPLRRHLLTPWPWRGALLAVLLFTPHLSWQVRHGWPTLEFIDNAQRFKIAERSALSFLAAQVDEIHPLAAPLWIGGLVFVLAGREGRRFRALGIVYLTALAFMLVQKSKPYYLGPAYTMLLAAGAVGFEPAMLRFRRWLPATAIAALVTGGLVAAPFSIPVLPVDTFIAYQRAMGKTPGNDERQAVGPLPPFFADRFGWEEMAGAVAAVYRSLPAADQAGAAIVAANYGEAGAIDYYGRAHGLPRAASTHNSYFLWGPPRGDAAVVIAVGISQQRLERTYEQVTPAGWLTSRYAMPYETRHPIHVCRGLKVPLSAAWQRAKNFI